MSTAVLDKPDVAPSDTSQDIHHIYCCDPDVSCCGLDISDEPEIDEADAKHLCEWCDMHFGTDCGDSRCPYRNVRQVWR